MFKRLLTALVVVAFGISVANAETANEVTTISGVARVIDGRTLSVDRTLVQLAGVDAAETGTYWGNNARLALTEFVADYKGAVTCKLTGYVDATNGRAIGRCYVGTDMDIAQLLIILGAALACPADDGDRYTPLERPGSEQPRSSRCAKDK